MRTTDLILRLLVSLCLIANGIGFAQASVRMQAMHLSHTPAVEAPIVEEEHGCHEEPDASAHADEAAGGSMAGDCCEGSVCQCACAHHATCAMSPLVITQPDLPIAGRLPIALAGHPSPQLPHLIRPPIR